MRFRRKHPDAEHGRRIPFIGKILMLIGFLTVLYLAIVYLLMPALALLTKTTEL